MEASRQRQFCLSLLLPLLWAPAFVWLKHPVFQLWPEHRGHGVWSKDTSTLRQLASEPKPWTYSGLSAYFMGIKSSRVRIAKTPPAPATHGLWEHWTDACLHPVRMTHLWGPVDCAWLLSELDTAFPALLEHFLKVSIGLGVTLLDALCMFQYCLTWRRWSRDGIWGYTGPLAQHVGSPAPFRKNVSRKQCAYQ